MDNLKRLILKGDLQKIEELNPDKNELNRINTNGYTPLSLAGEKGDLEIVKYLIGNGAKVNSECENPPLHRACYAGRLDIVRYLVENGADINKHDKSFYYRTPLHLAAAGGHLDIVKYLVKKGADPNSDDNFYSKPLFYASGGTNLELVEYLSGLDTNLNNVNMDGKTSLHAACGSGSADIIRVLILKGADVNIYTRSVRSLVETPLNIACSRGDPAIVRLLVESGADINNSDSHSGSPLHSAAFSGNLEAVKYLIQAGARPDIQKEGKTPLYEAEWNNQGKVSVYLKSLGQKLGKEEEEALYRERMKEASGILLAIIIFAYAGLAVYSREFFYKTAPLNNWLGTLNSMLFLAAALGTLFCLIFSALWPSNPGFLGNLRKLNGFYFGLIFGAVIGLILGYPARNVFKKYRVLYYSLPLLSMATWILNMLKK